MALRRCTPGANFSDANDATCSSAKFSERNRKRPSPLVRGKADPYPFPRNPPNQTLHRLRLALTEIHPRYTSQKDRQVRLLRSISQKHRNNWAASTHKFTQESFQFPLLPRTCSTPPNKPCRRLNLFYLLSQYTLPRQPRS